jgi:hypothetical protein
MNETLRNMFRIEPEPAPGEAARPSNPFAFVAVAAAILAYVASEVWGSSSVPVVLPLGLVGIAVGAYAIVRARRDRLAGAGLAILAIVAGSMAILIAFASQNR